MTNHPNRKLKLIRHDVDATISVYGPRSEKAYAGKKIRSHLGMIFKLGDGYLCTLTLSDRQAMFSSEAEAIAFYVSISNGQRIHPMTSEK